MAKVSVDFKKTDIDPKTGSGYYSIRATATEAVDMPTCIFVLQVQSNDTKGNKVASFSHVASPHDIAMYPEDEPGDAPYYRVSDIKLILPSCMWRDVVEGNIRKDIQFLVTSLNASDNTVTTETEVFS